MNIITMCGYFFIAILIIILLCLVVWVIESCIKAERAESKIEELERRITSLQIRLPDKKSR